MVPDLGVDCLLDGLGFFEEGSEELGLFPHVFGERHVVLGGIGMFMLVGVLLFAIHADGGPAVF